MHKHDAFGFADQVERPVEGGVASAEDDDVLACKNRGVFAAVVELRAFKFFNARNTQGARLEGADACRDDDDLRHEARACARLDVEAAVFLLFHLVDRFAKMKYGLEVMILLEQVFRQLVGRADGDGRNVVDGLCGIELHGLTADRLERVDDVAFDFEQTELENLKEPDGTGSDDDGIRLNEVVGGLGNDHVVFKGHFERSVRRHW